MSTKQHLLFAISCKQYHKLNKSQHCQSKISFFSIPDLSSIWVQVVERISESLLGTLDMSSLWPFSGLDLTGLGPEPLLDNCLPIYFPENMIRKHAPENMFILLHSVSCEIQHSLYSKQVEVFSLLNMFKLWLAGQKVLLMFVNKIWNILSVMSPSQRRKCLHHTQPLSKLQTQCFAETRKNSLERTIWMSGPKLRECLLYPQNWK